MSWDALVEFLAAVGALRERRPDAVVVGWPPASGDAARPILLERTEHFDEPWLVATVPLCPARDIDPRQALELNALLTIGEVATSGELCIVRYSAPLAQLGWRDVDRVLAMLAWTPAAVLARGHAGPGEGVFGHWT